MNSHLLHVFCAVLLTIYCSNGRTLKLNGEGEDQFNGFLKTQMENYGKWLKDNNLDPSPLDNGVLTLSRDYGRVFLECEVSDQFISGHSDLQSHNITTDSGFARDHYALFGRKVAEPYDFIGDFTCFGALQHIYYDELYENVYFIGHGIFEATMTSSNELVAIMNLGITDHYKLNLEHSWPVYVLQPTLGVTQLTGQWNETRIADQFLADIETTFQDLYRRFLVLDDRNMANPSSQLIYRYLREVLQNVTLTDVIDGENLPPVFVPTPSTTTPTTTTPTTTTTTTTPTTITTPSTTTANPDPSAEEQFNRFLATSMENYGVWLKDNNLDPSPPTTRIITLTRQFESVNMLRCEINAQFLSGHSDISNSKVLTSSSFGTPYYYARVGQKKTTQYRFNGGFRCSGELQASFYPELTSNVPFIGQGMFVVTVNSSEEFVAINNLGITEDAKFNLNHSWTEYALYPITTQSVQLIGQWDKPVINHKYLEDIQIAFKFMYELFLLRDDVNFDNPSGQLLSKYLRQVLENVTITDVISDPPPVLVPTPSTTTVRPQSRTSANGIVN